MSSLHENLSLAVVELPAAALRRMLELLRLLDRMSRCPAYRAEVYPQVPEVARFDPGHDAVMMCYDFHLAGDMPRLIEVNTNAGGGLLAYLAHDPSLPIEPVSLKVTLKERLLQTFADEIRQFSGGSKTRPERIVIVDDEPTEQFLYPEMRAFADLFNAWGVAADIVDPRQLQVSADGVRFDGQPVDLVYNRHCDFYLESEVMAGLRAAYLGRKVCLSPNPHAYGLLADKRRLVLWSDPVKRADFSLSAAEQALLDKTLPASSLLSDLDLQQVWTVRKQKVFKPVDSFGSRGVLLGEKISRKRFNELPAATTLVQDLVPPSLTDVPGNEPMKTDLRLYAYRDRALGVTARLYRGQVTNMRTPGGGFARVKVV
ncbi:MAG: hypothetical protein IH613_06180 [Desulfuromonadales bacterium]|nr:hypothetical protein [Desulfuromonadales bacterium]